MTTHRNAVAQSLLVLSLSLSAAALRADDDDCDVPVKQWQSREAVLRLAAQQGWQVQRLKIDDGCYELRGSDAQGREFKAKLDPGTLRVVKMKPRDRDRDRDRQRSDPALPGKGPPPPNATTPPATPATPRATPASPAHLTPGTAPRGQID